jgi:hypothetical protein
MRLISLRTASAAVVLTMLAVSGVAFVGGVAHAATWTGRAQHYGYFDNLYGNSNSPYPSGRGPVIDNNDYAPGDDAVPLSVTTKAQVYNYLYNKYKNPGTYGHPGWDRTGASFVVNTMLGNNPGTGSRAVSAAMWSDLQSRLNANSLSVNVQNVSASSYGNVNTYYQYGNDDVAWYNDPTESGRALVFTSGGKTVYVLLYKCANPLGSLAGLPKPPQWTITPTTTAQKTLSATNPALAANEVIPGDTITWRHVVKNNGPDATDQNVAWRYDNSGNLTGSGGNWTLPSGTASGKSVPNTSSYKATNGDLGKQVCRSTWAQPRAWNNSASISSAAVCYNVVYRYGLTPHATFNGSLEMPTELGSTTPITVNQSIDNSGPTLSQPTNLVLVKCTYAPNVPASTYGVTAPNSASSSVGAGCNPIWAGAGTYGSGTTTLANASGGSVPPNTAAGTHICYILSATPASATDGRWVHSVPACLSVTKSPKVQAWGADIRGGTIATRPNYDINGKYYGSWAEFGIFGTGPIAGMASNAALAGGSPSNLSIASLNTLTFANTPTLGNFQPAPAPNGYYTAYKALATSPTPPIPYGTVGNGTHEVIFVNSSLTLTNNIVYSGSYNSPGDIPRVIIVVNGDIKIDPTVTRIDAWLIANGTLYTCSDDTGAVRKQLTINDCNQQLVFNGPINVNDTRLSRTYGADGTSEGDPAEIFNLDPATFLSSYTASVSQSNIQTVYQKELPPRW